MMHLKVLTRSWFVELESSSGKGIYTAKAIQLAKIAINIKISNGLGKRVKESYQVDGSQ